MTHKTYTLTQRLTATFILAIIATLMLSLLAGQTGAFTPHTVTIGHTDIVSSVVDGLVVFAGVTEMLMFFTYSLSHEVSNHTKPAVISMLIVGAWTAIALVSMVLAMVLMSNTAYIFAQTTSILAVILMATVMPQVVN